MSMSKTTTKKEDELVDISEVVIFLLIFNITKNALFGDKEYQQTYQLARISTKYQQNFAPFSIC